MRGARAVEPRHPHAGGQEDGERVELDREPGASFWRRFAAGFLEQLYTFSGVDRDPRERVVSVAYYALVKPGAVAGGSDARRADVSSGSGSG